MAGDWLKMRVDLLTSPKVVRIMSGLKTDRLRVIGGLFAAWSIFDAHSEDGVLDGYDLETLDAMIGFPGFSQAMESVKWLEVRGTSLYMPRFDSHNGKSAKARAMDSERKRTARVRNLSGLQPDKITTREEKRREDNNSLSLIKISPDWLPDSRFIEYVSEAAMVPEAFVLECLVGFIAHHNGKEFRLDTTDLADELTKWVDRERRFRK